MTNLESYAPKTGHIDVGGGCWRHNILVTKSTNTVVNKTSIVPKIRVSTRLPWWFNEDCRWIIEVGPFSDAYKFITSAVNLRIYCMFLDRPWTCNRPKFNINRCSAVFTTFFQRRQRFWRIQTFSPYSEGLIFFWLSLMSFHKAKFQGELILIQLLKLIQIILTDLTLTTSFLNYKWSLAKVDDFLTLFWLFLKYFWLYCDFFLDKILSKGLNPA